MSTRPDAQSRRYLPKARTKSERSAPCVAGIERLDPMPYPSRIARYVRAFGCFGLLAIAANGSAQEPRGEYAFASQAVSCLSDAKSAQEVLARHSGEGSDLMASIVDMMTGARLAQARLTECRAGLAPFVKSSGQRAESAALFDRAVANLISAFSQSLDLQRKLLDADPHTMTPGKMALDVSELAATMDKAWRTLPVGLAAVTHALVQPRQENEEVGLLNLRPSQRDDLVKSLRSRFPDASKPGDKHAVDATAGLLIRFLTQPWRLLPE